jgi:hypothetical protein
VPSFIESLAQHGASNADGKGGDGASVLQGDGDGCEECLWCRVEGAGKGGGGNGAGVKGEVMLKIVGISDLLASSEHLSAEYEALPV